MREELEDELEGAGELRLVLLEEPLGEVVLMRVLEDPEERTSLLMVVWEELLEGLLLDERELLPEGAALVLELLLEGVAEEDLVLDEVVDLEPVLEDVEVADLEPVPDAGAVAVVALDPVLPELAVADLELDVAALTLSLRSRAFAALTCEEPKLSLAGTSG